MIISQPVIELAAQYGERGGSRLARVLLRLRLRTDSRAAYLTRSERGAADGTISPPLMVAAPDDTADEVDAQAAAITIGSSATSPVAQPACYRRARAALLRGMLLARKGNYPAAVEAFSEALDLDPTVDLVADADIWTLPRGGLDAAVEAYERVGRLREASRLATLIRRRLTPRAVRATPA